MANPTDKIMASALKLSLLLALAVPVWAGDIVIGKFGGLNTNDSPVTLEDGEAQDLLNVNLTVGGKSVKKRGGYGLHKTLSISTSAVHGSHYFQDLNGSDVQLWGNDGFLNATVSGGSPVQIATGTANSTWQCADSVGYAYCLTSNRNMAVRTSGTSATTTYQNGIPLGTMLTFTPDRLVVAGVSGNESTLYFSQSNTFTNFTTNVLDSSPFTEVISAPGSRITHVKYACGKILWWKDNSFGYSVGSTQYDLENVTISQNIGTLDNSSDEYNGHVYFRGQDSHIYDYDCSNVTRLSRSITPTVSGANRRRSNSWTQSSQVEFSNGAVSFNNGIPALSTASVPGSIVPSTFHGTAYSSSTFLPSGTTSNLNVWPSSITLATNNSGNITDNSFESGTGFFWSGSNWINTNSLSDAGFSIVRNTSQLMQCGTATPYDGSNMGQVNGGLSTITFKMEIVMNGSIINSVTFPYDNDCTWRQLTVPGVGVGLRVKFRLHLNNATSSRDEYLTTGDSYILGGTSTVRYIYSTTPTGNKTILFDLVELGSSTITSGWYMSGVYDSSFSSSSISIQSVFSSNTSTPTFAVYSSTASNGVFSPVVVSTTTSALGNRYVKFSSTISITGEDSALTYISSITVVGRSTGTYYSAVNQATSLSSFDTFSSDYQLNGGTITYYTRASTGSFTILSSTPIWHQQSVNATVNYASGTYMQMRADFGATSVPQTPTINDFSFNWFEGSASDKSYIKFWDDYVWIAVSSGTSGLNNRIFRWDTNNEAWLIDDIASNGFLVDNNRLFFGSPSVGKIYVYDKTLKTDDSGNINSFWKSKDFLGEDPFLQKTFDQADFIVNSASGTTLSVTYTLDTTSSTIVNLNLYDPVHPGTTMIRKGNYLNGHLGYFMNVKFSDNSSNSPWEVMGARFKYSPQPWRPK